DAGEPLERGGVEDAVVVTLGLTPVLGPVFSDKPRVETANGWHGHRLYEPGRDDTDRAVLPSCGDVLAVIDAETVRVQEAKDRCADDGIVGLAETLSHLRAQLRDRRRVLLFDDAKHGILDALDLLPVCGVQLLERPGFGLLRTHPRSSCRPNSYTAFDSTLEHPGLKTEPVNS